MTEETKKQVLKCIDEIAACRDELTSLEDKRRKATAELDRKISEKYNEVNALEEKKRLLMLGDNDGSNPGHY